MIPTGFDLTFLYQACSSYPISSQTRYVPIISPDPHRFRCEGSASSFAIADPYTRAPKYFQTKMFPDLFYVFGKVYVLETKLIVK